MLANFGQLSNIFAAFGLLIRNYLKSGKVLGLIYCFTLLTICVGGAITLSTKSTFAGITRQS